MNVDSERFDPEAPKLLLLGEHVHVRQEIDNIAWLDLGGAVLVVDALERPELEGEVFSALADTVGTTPVRYVINTHTHYDHVALNAVFQKRCGAEIINMQTTELGPDGYWIEGRERGVRVLAMPGCHTDQDCVVWVPDDRVLFVGDIFGWGLIPWDRTLTADKRELLLATYERLIAFDAAHVVPGHGPVCTTAELQRWVEYFNWLPDMVRTARETELTDAEIKASGVPAPEDMHSWWRFLLWKHADSVGKINHALKRGRL